MDEFETDDDRLIEGLVEWDEALVRGNPSVALGSTVISSDENSLLDKGKRCLNLLRRLGGTTETRKAIRLDTSLQATSSITQMHSKFGRFTVLRELGRGGYGVVFLARDEELNRKVALKVPHAFVLTRPELESRFKQEARAAAVLDHPNIVQVYEAGTVGPIAYIASAYCPGVNLAEWLLKRRDLMSYQDAASVIEVLALAIQHAHQRGVLHRDLKPANVILQAELSATEFSVNARGHDTISPDPILFDAALDLTKWTPRITDFGLAKTLGEGSFETISGAVLGTPSYMAPEQARGVSSPFEHRADIYSLGAMLYQLLTGKVPFQGNSPVETLHQVINQDVVRPSRLRPSIPRDLETICLKCLEKDPRARYETAEALAGDLHHYLRSEPILARPNSRLELFGRACRRKPLLAALSTALFLSVFVGFIVITLLYRLSEKRGKGLSNALGQSIRANAEANAQRGKSDRLLYLNDIAFAQSEVEYNVDRAQLLLDACKPSHKHWEWYHLQAHCNSFMLSFEGHRSAVTTCKFSPDGGMLATGGATWRSSGLHEVILWDLRKGAEIRRLSVGTYSIMSVAFHPNGNWLAVAEYNWNPGTSGTVKVYSIGDGALIANLTEAKQSFDLEFAPDGSRLIAVTGQGKVAHYETAHWGLERSSFAHDRENIFAVAIHPAGRIFATGARNGTVEIRDIEAGGLLHSIENLMDVRDLKFTPDGKLLVIATFSGTLKIWDVENQSSSMEYAPREGGLGKIDLSPDGQKLAMSGGKAGPQIRNLRTGFVLQNFSSHNKHTSCVAFSPDGSMFATSGTNGKVRIWDLTAPSVNHQLTELDSYISDAVEIPGKEWMALASKRHGSRSDLGVGDYSLRLVDTVSGQILKTCKGHADWLTSVDVSKDGEWLLTGSIDKTARLWSVATGMQIGEISGTDQAVNCAVFGFQDRYVVTVGDDNVLRTWQTKNQQPKVTLTGHTDRITQIASSPVANILVSVSLDTTARIWDIERELEVSILRDHSAPINAVSFCENGSLFATADERGEIRVWRCRLDEDEKFVVEDQPFVITCPDRNILEIGFSSDGRRLLSSSENGIVRLWDTEYGLEAMTISNQSNSRPHAFFSRDQTRIFVTHAGQLHVAEAPFHLPTFEQRIHRHSQDLDRWHEQESKKTSPSQLPTSVLFHLDRISTEPESDPTKQSQRLELRGDAFAESGLWKPSETAFSEAIALTPNRWILLRKIAMLKLAQGDLLGFSRILNEHYSDRTPNLSVAEFNSLAWTAAISPSTVVDLDGLHSKLKELISLPEHRTIRPELLRTERLLLLRMGRLAEARKSIEADSKAGYPNSDSSGSKLRHWLVESLIWRGLGDTQKSHSLVDKVRSVMAEEAKPALQSNPRDIPWHERTEIRFWLQELQSVTRE